MNGAREPELEPAQEPEQEPDLEPAPGLTLEGALPPIFGPVELALTPGRWTCLLGRSGVGKSSILRLLLGLETGGRFQGRITPSDGQPLEGRISYMAQQDLLLPWLDITQNVCLGARLRGEAPDRQAADALISRVGLSEHAHKKPAQLSGGMRQRAALARTLMEDRPIVLLDEPFSALDAATRAEMQDLAAEVLQGRTVLLVTHDPGEVARLGQVILIMEETGITHWKDYDFLSIRGATEAETLATQAALLEHLRGQSA